mmetsp:Transcript_13464/g.34536  ORF Transcript_13464/g.34536 Transcript_13464/m.34536 type:complete len:242 (-) Transcript_13464:1394-2119(-)
MWPVEPSLIIRKKALASTAHASSDSTAIHCVWSTPQIAADTADPGRPAVSPPSPFNPNAASALVVAPGSCSTPEDAGTAEAPSSAAAASLSASFSPPVGRKTLPRLDAPSSAASDAAPDSRPSSAAAVPSRSAYMSWKKATRSSSFRRVFRRTLELRTNARCTSSYLDDRTAWRCSILHALCRTASISRCIVHDGLQTSLSPPATSFTATDRRASASYSSIGPVLKAEFSLSGRMSLCISL